MTTEELEREIQRLATKQDLAELKAEIFKAMLDFQGRIYQMTIGTYTLIIVGIFINHFWK